MHANDREEREAARTMAERIKNSERVTVAVDKVCDVREFAGAMRDRNVTRHVGYRISQRKRNELRKSLAG
jgi:hypothetical protein